MQDIRKVLCWIFAAASLGNLFVFARCLLYGLRYHYPPSLLRVLVVSALVSGIVALCSGVGWWAVWRKNAFARSCAIAASMSSILIFVRPFIFPTQPVWDHHVGALFIGAVGLIAFAWPEKLDDSTSEGRHATQTGP